MKEGDFVVVPDGNRQFRAIGRVAGPYEHYRSDEYGQKRPVEWLLVPEESISSEKISRKNFSQRTLYELSQKDLKIEALNELLNRAATGEPSNHVLIVDEINRGNISKILGELITLLEPDKRLGQPNELRSKLPYTGTNFGVPANLYVIGTMNTADRSIAFLDTALRRRFEFEEIMPDSGVIRDHVGDEGQLADVNVARLLDTINGRIERLFDRDHTIGHSYLLGCRSLVDLQQAFRKRVIPLLQEYFYGDWDRVCLVLGCPWDGQGAQPTCANNHPIIVGTPMATLPLGSTNGDEYEERLRHEVNQEFLNADEKSLAPFFNGIISVEGGA
jgi:5-methylcytosine-specific restriction endonuclease McrBC GTP-binding regulatory subunit McrB